MTKMTLFTAAAACLISSSLMTSAPVRADGMKDMHDDHTMKEMPPSSQPSASAAPINKMCPITGEAIDPALTTVYQGKTVAFCCPDCVKTFNKDPDKYMAKMK